MKINNVIAAANRLNMFTYLASCRLIDSKPILIER